MLCVQFHQWTVPLQSISTAKNVKGAKLIALWLCAWVWISVIAGTFIGLCASALSRRMDWQRTFLDLATYSNTVHHSLVCRAHQYHTYVRAIIHHMHMGTPYLRSLLFLHVKAICRITGKLFIRSCIRCPRNGIHIGILILAHRPNPYCNEDSSRTDFFSANSSDLILW